MGISNGTSNNYVTQACSSIFWNFTIQLLSGQMKKKEKAWENFRCFLIALVQLVVPCFL